MRRLFIPLVLFLFLILEGVAISLLPERLLISQYLIVPHWVLVGLILISIFYDSYETMYAVIYAAIFGLLIDIVYTDLIGVYMFGYSISVYLVHLLKKLFVENLLLTIVIAIIALIFVELFIVFAYTITDSINLSVQSLMIDRIIPTTIANLIFLIVLYPLVTKTLIKWRKKYISDF